MSKTSGGGAAGSKKSTSSAQKGRTRAGFSNDGLPTTGEIDALFNSLNDSTTREEYRKVLKGIRALPKVTFNPYSQHQQAKQDLGLSNISDNEFAAMFGALDGSNVWVARDFGNKFNVAITNKFTDNSQKFVMYKDQDGKLVISNELIIIKKDYQKNKLGTISFAKQAYFAAKNGVKSIKLYAAKNERMNGYYTWIRLGFDRNLTSNEARRAKSRFGKVSTAQDIMGKKNGKVWWSEYGEAGNASFNLNKGSVNSKILKKYIRESLPLKYITNLKSLQ